MSRAAVLAHEQYEQLAEQERTQRRELSETARYRLLGEGHYDPFGGIWDTPELVARDLPGYMDRPLEMPPAFYAAQPQESRPGLLTRVWRRALLMVGIAALLAVALSLVTPVLASGRVRQAGLVLSRYSEASLASAGGPAAAPEIDASSAVALEQPAEAPAEAQPPAQSTAPGSYDLVSAPSLSVRQIEDVLSQYRSPAAGQGQVIFDMGVKYGIDPAYALAFFVHESGCGTQGVARYTMSLGNIRWTSGFENYQGYRKYTSWQASIEDWYKLITDLYINGWGLRTVDAIIPVYAPTGDGNNPAAYIASVKWLVDSWRGK
jgi:hypothetical protein